MSNYATYRLEDKYHSLQQYQKQACFSCGIVSAHVSTCTRCRRVAYCTTTCQKLDFPTHKHICKAWAQVRGINPSSSYPVLESYPPDEFELRDVMRSMSADLDGPLRVRLGQRAGKVANYLVLYEPRCGRCLKVDEAGGHKLECCKDCVYRWCATAKCRDTCSGKHKESGLCTKLQRIAKDEQFLRNHEIQDRKPHEGPVPVWCPERVVRTDTPLPADWNTYGNSVKAPHRNVRNGELERVFFQHSMSVPLTIVAALERFGLRSKFSDASDPKDLTVHLLGAEVDYEIMMVGFAYEEITHLLPGVKRLRLVFVGPTLNVESEGVDEQQCCPSCVRDERTRIIETRRSTYHDYVRTQKPSPPDLAVGFNSGMHEEPQNWSPSLSVLLANRTPSVFTSYDSLEASHDAKAVARKAGAGIEWVWREENNPWKGGRDHLDVFSPKGTWAENSKWMGWRGV